jgi:hypothetical protein
VRLGVIEQESVEVTAVSEQRLGGHRGQQIGQVGQLPRRSHGKASERAHERRAVGERKPLLGLQLKRFQTELGKGVRGAAPLAVERDRCLADERPAHVRERDQVAAGATGAALGNQRKDVVVEQVEQALNELDPDARVALRQAVCAQQDRDPRHLGRCDRPGATAEEPQQVALQLGGLARGDLPVGAVAQTGRHPVDRDLLRDQAPLELAACANGVGGGVRQHHRPVAPRHFECVFDRQRCAVELERRALPALV